MVWMLRDLGAAILQKAGSLKRVLGMGVTWPELLRAQQRVRRQGDQDNAMQEPKREKDENQFSKAEDPAECSPKAGETVVRGVA